MQARKLTTHPNPVIQLTFRKVSDQVIDEIKNPYAGWLLMVIMRHIDRRNNSLQMSDAELADAAGMSRSSVKKWKKWLRQQGYIHYDSRKCAASQNEVTHYRLTGLCAKVAIDTVTPLPRTSDIGVVAKKPPPSFSKPQAGFEETGGGRQKTNPWSSENQKKESEYLEKKEISEIPPMGEELTNSVDEVLITMDSPLSDDPMTRAWQSAWYQLELQLDRASFDTWLRPAEYVGFSDNAFTIRAHNSYAKTMCEGRLYRNIRRTLRDISNTECEVIFIAPDKTTTTYLRWGQGV